MKLREKILLASAVIFSAVILFPVIRHYQLKAAVNHYRAELKAKGDWVELAEVLLPPLPEGKNAAHLFSNAISALNTNRGVLWSNQPPVMRMVTFGRAMIGWQQPFIRNYLPNQTSNSWDEIDAALVSEGSGLSLLRQLPSEPVFDFRLNYDGGFRKMKFSPLAPAKAAVLKLEASASANLRRNDTAMAEKDIQAILSIAQGFVHDQILISELVRYALLQIAVTSTWEFMQSTNLTDDELAALQLSWQKSELIRPLERAILVERGVSANELKEMRSNGLQSYIYPADELGLVEREKGVLTDLKVKYKCFMWRWWWSYPDEMRLMQGQQMLLQVLRQIETNQPFCSARLELEEQITSLGIQPASDESFWFGDPAKTDFRFILSDSVPIFAASLNKAAKTETARQITIASIALKRWQLKHGSYPADLNSLVPEFLVSIPLDPMDGQPLRYRPNADGSFTLYSVGENGKDDGGNPALEPGTTSSSFQWQNSHALDWVWPQPATEAEIQKYYEEQTKQAK